MREEMTQGDLFMIWQPGKPIPAPKPSADGDVRRQNSIMNERSGHSTNKHFANACGQHSRLCGHRRGCLCVCHARCSRTFSAVYPFIGRGSSRKSIAMLHGIKSVLKFITRFFGWIGSEIETSCIFCCILRV